MARRRECGKVGEMKAKIPLLVFLIWGSVCLAQEPAYKGQSPETVKTEDGRSFQGMVSAKDDYTLVIESVTGLANVPIAALQGESWKKYSRDKERKEDGRFWSERREALTLKWEKGDKATPLDKALEEIIPHMGAITVYETAQTKNKETNSGTLASKPQGKGAEAAPRLLFSGPSGLGSAGVPSLPTQAPTLPSVPSFP